jgi:tetratricopeptide (TPR) repeat protein
MASPSRKPSAPPEKDKNGRSHEVKYREALAAFTAAVELVYQKEYARAREAFREIEAAHIDELALVDRSRMYARICAARLATPTEAPSDFDGLYHRAVMHTNNGDYDPALGLLERALKLAPDSAKALYARSCVWALKGNADAAVADLRRAIAAEPNVRYQAANDPDFETIREEPSFIDIIEPTPAGG